MKRIFLLLLSLVLVLSGCGGGSSEDPDALAEALGSAYGITLLAGKDAGELSPWDYTLVPDAEDQTAVTRLKALDDQLRVYPKGMLQALSKDCGGLTIALVQEIRGKEEAGSLTHARGIQFRTAENGICIAIAKDQAQTLYHELFHVMEEFLKTRTDLLEDWESLNPKGFQYDLTYQDYQDRAESPWLQGPHRSFVDAYSMSFPREDRARVLEYAMLEGQAALFESPVMQEKLRLLSSAIRQGFGLEDYREPLLWEQYLKEKHR